MSGANSAPALAVFAYGQAPEDGFEHVFGERYSVGILSVTLMTFDMDDGKLAINPVGGGNLQAICAAN